MHQTQTADQTTDQTTDQLGVLVQRHLDLESGVAEALEALNTEISALLDDAGIYGPKEAELNGLAPLVETVQQRYASSQKSRDTLASRSGMTDMPNSSDDHGAENLRSLLATMPTRESAELDASRKSVLARLLDAQQKLTANQVVIFYSMEFHRRYLLGVLQCDVDESNYQADGQAFKLPPEKIFGRNC